MNHSHLMNPRKQSCSEGDLKIVFLKPFDKLGSPALSYKHLVTA